LTVEVEHRLNGRTLKRNRTYGEEMAAERVMEELLKDLHFYNASGGGVTFSGGEPMLQAEELEILLRLCRQEGLHTAVDTSGYAAREDFDRIMEHTDLFLYDLKIMDPELHLRYTGVDNRLIHTNADHLLSSGARVILRIPVVPQVNTQDEETGRLVAFVRERSSMIEAVHLLPYHRIAAQKYCRMGLEAGVGDLEEPGKEVMNAVQDIFISTGLPVSIGG